MKGFPQVTFQYFTSFFPFHATEKNPVFFNGSQSLMKNYHSILQNSNRKKHKQQQNNYFKIFSILWLATSKKKKLFFRGKPLNVYYKKSHLCYCSHLVSLHWAVLQLFLSPENKFFMQDPSPSHKKNPHSLNFFK